MPFLDVNLEDAPTFSSVPAGEYEIQCVGVSMGESKNPESSFLGHQYIRLLHVIPSEPTSKEVSDMLWLPHPDAEERDNNRRLEALRDACLAFGVEFGSGGFEPEDFKGQTAFAVLKERETAEYGMQNDVTRYIVPA